MTDDEMKLQKEIDQCLEEGYEYIFPELKDEWYKYVSEMRLSSLGASIISHFLKQVVHFLKTFEEKHAQGEIEATVREYVFQPYAKDISGQDMYHEDSYIFSLSRALLRFSKYGPEASMAMRLAMFDRNNEWCKQNFRPTESSMRMTREDMQMYIETIARNRELASKEAMFEQSETKQATDTDSEKKYTI